MRVCNSLLHSLWLKMKKKTSVRNTIVYFSLKMSFKDMKHFLEYGTELAVLYVVMAAHELS